MKGEKVLRKDQKSATRKRVLVSITTALTRIFADREPIVSKNGDIIFYLFYDLCTSLTGNDEFDSALRNHWASFNRLRHKWKITAARPKLLQISKNIAESAARPETQVCSSRSLELLIRDETAITNLRRRLEDPPIKVTQSVGQDNIQFTLGLPSHELLLRLYIARNELLQESIFDVERLITHLEAKESAFMAGDESNPNLNMEEAISVMALPELLSLRVESDKELSAE